MRVRSDVIVDIKTRKIEKGNPLCPESVVEGDAENKKSAEAIV